jgi:hypothetical protein
MRIPLKMSLNGSIGFYFGRMSKKIGFSMIENTVTATYYMSIVTFESKPMSTATAFDQIRSAKARYCRFIDTKQWDAFAALMIPAPSIRFYDPEGALFASFDEREPFVAASSGFLGKGRSIHQIHNEELTQVSDTEIRAIWSMEDYIVFPDGSAPSVNGFGHYHETWIRTADGWRLAALELRRTIVEVGA